MPFSGFFDRVRVVVSVWFYHTKRGIRNEILRQSLFGNCFSVSAFCQSERNRRFYLANKLRNEKEFKYYLYFSLTSIIEIIVNAIIIAAAAAPPKEYYEYEIHVKEYMGPANGTIMAIYLSLIFWLILNSLSANQCVKDGM